MTGTPIVAQVPQTVWEIRPCYLNKLSLLLSGDSEIIGICTGKNDSLFNLKIRTDCQIIKDPPT